MVFVPFLSLEKFILIQKLIPAKLPTEYIIFVFGTKRLEQMFLKPFQKLFVKPKFNMYHRSILRLNESKLLFYCNL